MQRELIAKQRGGMWPWLGQRITAVLVLVTILVHMILTHILAIGKLNDANVAHRLAHVAVAINDVILLAAVLFHALNGVRVVLMDLGYCIHRHKAVFWVCMAVAAATLTVFAVKAAPHIF